MMILLISERDTAMNIKEEKINYIKGLPCHARLCRISAIQPHYHSHDLELIFCLEGSIDLVAGHQNVTVHAGEIFSVDFRDIHYLHSSEDNLVLLFHLDLQNLDMDWNYLQEVFFSCESSHCYPYQQEAMDKVAEIILSLSFVLHCDSDEAQFQKISQASNLLLDTLYKYFNWYNYEHHDEYINEDLHDRFYRTIAYCNENYMNKISISQLAEKEHINRNYFSQFISRTVFESFSLMVKYIRCYEAEQLLLKTEMPIAEISYSCGFSDPKYFYSAFKHWWKCTPTEHRRKYGEYLRSDFKSEQISGQTAIDLIRQHIANWHLNRTFR